MTKEKRYLLLGSVVFLLLLLLFKGRNTTAIQAQAAPNVVFGNVEIPAVTIPPRVPITVNIPGLGPISFPVLPLPSFTSNTEINPVYIGTTACACGGDTSFSMVPERANMSFSAATTKEAPYWWQTGVTF